MSIKELYREKNLADFTFNEMCVGDSSYDEYLTTQFGYPECTETTDNNCIRDYDFEEACAIFGIDDKWEVI